MTFASARKHLETVMQREFETVQNYNMRHRLNDLRYEIQNKYNRPTSKRIAFGEEEDAIEFYVKNLLEDIGGLVIFSNPRTLLEAQRKVSDIEL